MTTNEIRGLYFPYANIQSAKTLKTAVLYFDKIGIINPNTCFCGDAEGKELNWQASGIINEISALVQEGIVEYVDPAQSVSTYGDEMLTGIIQDLQNKDFEDICKPFIDSSWVLSSEKLPGNFDKLFHDMLVNIPALAHGKILSQREQSNYSEKLKELLKNDPDLILRNPQLLDHALQFAREDRYFGEFVFGRLAKNDRGFYNRYREGLYNERFRERYYEERHSRYKDEYDATLLRQVMLEEYRIAELPFIVGESVMIGHALVAAASGDFTPFCDGRVHFDALQARLRSLTNSNPLKVILCEYGYIKDVKTDLAAFEVINETVPSLESVPIDKILKFREKRIDELERYRIEMRKIITEVDANPWGREFYDHVNDLFDTKVKPALKEVTDQISGCKDDFWVDAVKSIAGISPLPIIGSIFAGVPAHIAVGLGATFAGLTLILDQWRKAKKIKRNGWALLIDAGHLGRRKQKILPDPHRSQ